LTDERNYLNKLGLKGLEMVNALFPERPKKGFLIQFETKSALTRERIMNSRGYNL